MIPYKFVRIDEVPLNSSGKADRRKLSNLDVETTINAKYSLPESAVESKVLQIWQDILNVNNVNVLDRFFEIGGNSILAITTADRISKELNCQISVNTLFQYTNIKELSNYISNELNALLENNEQSVPISRNDLETEENIKENYPDYYKDSVSIIGISCNFPGADNHHEFWKNLQSGTESVKIFTKEELELLDLPESIIVGKNFIAAQSTINDKDAFDPDFFNISYKDAEYMDPQFRHLLLHSWKALEDAGYRPEQVSNTSVYISASNNFYQALLAEITESEGVLENADQYVSWILGQGGTIPTMISYKLGLKGPSLFVNSNCSSSLVGLSLAYQSLINNEANTALVGAATIFPTSRLGYLHQAGLNFSSDGHVRTFDESADGMVSGEGAGVILLKRTIDAINDGDHVYAIVRGVGVNNDGTDKVGFYAPSINGQSEVIEKVLHSTQVEPKSISYIEAHGTGTKLGDPIEFAALNNVYKDYTNKKKFCGLGSVKTNIGHLDTAAGLAGIIKTAMCLQKSTIPPSINFKNINSGIDLDNSPFYIVDKLTEITSNYPHRAGVSSFGIGGTNAHAILEKAIQTQNNNQDLVFNYYIVPISAKNKNCLYSYTSSLAKFITDQEKDYNQFFFLKDYIIGCVASILGKNKEDIISDRLHPKV